MIKKLRKKFVITATLAVFGLLTAILLVINFVNFALVADDADRVLEKIVSGGGSFGSGPQVGGMPGQPMQGEQGPMRPVGPNSPEIGQTTRYFTVNYDADGAVTGVEMHMSIVDSASATAWANSLLGGKGGWTRTYYRYKVWTDGSGTHVTVIDQGRELLPSYRVLIASLIGGGVGMVVTILALLGISKLVVTPIEQSDRRQKRFVADAAHSLKNPITVIDTSRHVIELRNGESEETKAIGKEVARLTKLVEGLDQLLPPEERAPDKRDIDLSALVLEVASPYVGLFEAAGKTLSLDVQEGLLLQGEPVALGEMMGILLDNALLYSLHEASLTLTGGEGRTTLVISNDAQGVTDGPLDSVFERFYRSEAAKESGIDGNGLGLSVAKEIVGSHGGRIMAEGKAGRFVLKAEL